MEKKEKNKKRIIVAVAIILILIVAIRMIACQKETKEKPKTETVEVVQVDYLQYVKGLKDWKVEQNIEVDFMQGVKWDDEKVEIVVCDSSKVDLTKVGKYEIEYKVVAKEDADMQVSKKCEVEVLSTEDAQKLAESGEEVVLSEGIKNEEEAKASSMTDEGAVVKDEKGNKVKVEKDKNGKVVGKVEKPKKDEGSKNPLHKHDWKEVTDKNQVVSKPAWEEKVLVKEAWVEKKLVKDAYTEKKLVKEAYTEKKLVKEAWDEPIYKEVPVYDRRSICNRCGADITKDVSGHMQDHMLKGEYENCSYTNKTIQVGTKKEQTGTKHHDAVYNDVYHPAEYKDVYHPAEYKEVKHPAEYKVVKHPAEYKTVTKTYYKCSCGAKK